MLIRRKAWRWRAIAGAILLALATGLRALETNATWLVEQVPLSSLSGATRPSNEQPSARVLIATSLDWQPVLLVPRQSAWAKRWTQFEADFGIHRVNPSAMLGAIESAKYAADWTSLTMQEWLETVNSNLSFSYELRNLTRDTPALTPARQIHGNLWRDAWENARFQSDIDLRLTGRAFIGVKLVLPIGD